MVQNINLAPTPLKQFGLYWIREQGDLEELVLVTPFQSLAKDTFDWGNAMLNSLTGIRFDNRILKGGKFVVRVCDVRQPLKAVEN
jgi:hypothetical protein